ncbi:MAG: hypothetical protein Q9157_006509, partial [Trypethelium eluteriae]
VYHGSRVVRSRAPWKYQLKGQLVYALNYPFTFIMTDSVTTPELVVAVEVASDENLMDWILCIHVLDMA